jgi:hypothetical protein
VGGVGALDGELNGEAVGALDGELVGDAVGAAVGTTGMDISTARRV